MLLALVSPVLFALMYVLVRQAQRRAGPDGGMLLTTVFTVALLTALIAGELLLGGHEPLSWLGLLVFVAAGLLTTFLGRTLHFASLRRIGPERAVSYRITSPAVTTVLAVLFLGERVGTGPLLGLVIAGTGLWIFTRATARDRRREGRTGVVLALLAALSFGTGHAMRKLGLLIVPSPYLGAWIGSLVALLALLTQLRARHQLGAALVSSLRPVQWGLILAGSLSGAAQLALYAAFYLAPVSLASGLSTTEPLFTVLFSRWLLKDETPLTRTALLGMVVTVAGVVAILVT